MALPDESFEFVLTIKKRPRAKPDATPGVGTRASRQQTNDEWQHYNRQLEAHILDVRLCDEHDEKGPYQMLFAGSVGLDPTCCDAEARSIILQNTRHAPSADAVMGLFQLSDSDDIDLALDLRLNLQATLSVRRVSDGAWTCVWSDEADENDRLPFFSPGDFLFGVFQEVPTRSARFSNHGVRVQAALCLLDGSRTRSGSLHNPGPVWPASVALHWYNANFVQLETARSVFSALRAADFNWQVRTIISIHL